MNEGLAMLFVGASLLVALIISVGLLILSFCKEASIADEEMENDKIEPDSW